ncbi:MAG: MFS transporter [Oscillospiraceae bacterium]|jgi:Na+/melibiose symporter-like transporter|nr:MFS transporter [Oscillospiraceae bacterium]
MAKTTGATEKLNYKKTILTGFGFMATSIAWAIYDPYITKILNKFLTDSSVIARWSEKLQGVSFLENFMASQGESTLSAAGKFTLVPLFIGIIMTFDNIFGVIFQPTFGKLSDRCHSRLGKRRPFILIGAPISAILFALIPWMDTLPALMLCIILFVFVMSLWRAPVVALMPDLTPPALRSEGNAVINLMGGLGGGLGMVAGTIITAVYIKLAGIEKLQDEFKTFPYVFLIGAIVMVLGMLVLMLFVKEKDSRLLSAETLRSRDEAAHRAAEKAAKAQEKAARKTQKLSKAERVSLVMMLVSLFFLFCGSNAITTFFALFADEILHMTTAQATMLMLIFAVCSMLSAIPSGALGKRLGRRKTIIIGLAIFLAAFLLFFGVFVGLSGSKGLSMKDYTTLNHAYSELEARVAEENLIIQQKIDIGEAADADLFATAEFADYLGQDQFSEKYAAFEQQLNTEQFDLNRYNTLARDILGLQGTDLGESLGAIEETIGGTVSLLKALIYPVLVLAGAAYMMITVNTLPLVLEIGGIEKVGTFTGYYYTATFSAQIASPIVYGIFRMFSGTYLSLFYYSPIACALALAFILFVRHGEAIPQQILKAAEE